MNVPTFVKVALTPGSLAFLAWWVLVGLGMRFMWPGSRRFAAIWLFAVLALYLVLALPVVAVAIVRALPAVPAIEPGQLRGAELIVVFDGDNRVGRVGEALRIHQAVPTARIVVVGEPWIAESLVARGLPQELVTQEPGPPTTREQVDWLGRRQGGGVVLVASRLQMPRVAALVKSGAVSLQLAPSPIDDEPAAEGVWRFRPTYLALRASRDALYEHAALIYYRWRGWTR